MQRRKDYDANVEFLDHVVDFMRLHRDPIASSTRELGHKFDKLKQQAKDGQQSFREIESDLSDAEYPNNELDNAGFTMIQREVKAVKPFSPGADASDASSAWLKLESQHRDSMKFDPKKYYKADSSGALRLPEMFAEKQQASK